MRLSFASRWLGGNSTTQGLDVVEADDVAIASQSMSNEAPLPIVLDLSLQAVGGLDLLRAPRRTRRCSTRTADHHSFGQKR
jgi:DNA-binding response OmpR family regulator